jgi:hypothetical protein
MKSGNSIERIADVHVVSQTTTFVKLALLAVGLNVPPVL